MSIQKVKLSDIAVSHRQGPKISTTRVLIIAFGGTRLMWHGIATFDRTHDENVASNGSQNDWKSTITPRTKHNRAKRNKKNVSN